MSPELIPPGFDLLLRQAAKERQRRRAEWRMAWAALVLAGSVLALLSWATGLVP